MSDSIPDSIIPLRDHLLRAIRVIAENPDANEGELLQCLRSLGYESLEAELLVAFVPLGLARAIIDRLRTAVPIGLSNHVLVIKAGQELKIPLVLVPEFVEALYLGEETFTSGIIPKEDFTQAVGLSVELNLINQALMKGTTIINVAAPILLRLGETPGFEDWYSRINSQPRSNRL